MPESVAAPAAVASRKLRRFIMKRFLQLMFYSPCFTSLSLQARVSQFAFLQRRKPVSAAFPVGRAAREPWVTASPARTLALHAEQFDIEDQRRVRRDDAAGAAGAVAERRRNDQRALAADLHRGDALVPPGDHLPAADRKLERLTAVDRGVELLALGAVLIEPAGVVHDAGLAGLRARAGADLGVDDLQA